MARPTDPICRTQSGWLVESYEGRSPAVEPGDGPRWEASTTPPWSSGMLITEAATAHAQAKLWTSISDALRGFLRAHLQASGEKEVEGEEHVARLITSKRKAYDHGELGVAVAVQIADFLAALRPDEVAMVDSPLANILGCVKEWDADKLRAVGVEVPKPTEADQSYVKIMEKPRVLGP